jgi:hypothetical protein
MEPGQEGPNQQVVHVPWPRFSSELLSKMGHELTEIPAVGCQCVGRDVTFAL